MSDATAAAPGPRYCWEDFAPGREILTGAVEVTADEIVEFARRYDPQPFHVDDAAARHSLFGGLVASGWMTASLSMRLMCDAYLLDSSSLGSPGLEQLKWLKPVRPGDRLQVRVTVIETRPMNSRPEVGLVKSRTQTLNQHGEVVLSMEAWGMYRRRTPAP